MARHPDSRSTDAAGTCVIYTRVSQDRYKTEDAVERQEKDCRKKAKELGLKVVAVYSDNDRSATDGRIRDDFEAMLAARPEAIISWHQDRLLRLTKDLERIIDLNVPVHFCKSGSLDLSTPAGRTVGRTVAAWSQYETEQKALRRVAANEQRAQKGAWQFSRRPFGFDRVDGEIVHVPDEAKAIRQAYKAYLTGKSYQAIADGWNKRGITTPGGKAFRAIDAMHILRNPRMAGIVVYKGVVYPEAKPQWEPIITMKVWEEFQRVKSGRKQSGAPSAGKPKHLLSGFAVCGVCGDRLYATWALRKKRKNGTRAPSYRVYTCTRTRCTSIGSDQLEALIVPRVLAQISDPRVIAQLKQVPDTAPLEEELAAVRMRRKNLAELVGDGVLRPDEARPKLAALGQDAERLESRLAAMRSESPLAELALADQIPDRWERLDIVRRRQILEALGLRIIVNRADRGPDGKRGPWVLDSQGNRTIDPARLRVEWIGQP
ncbi:recombinase family protein [Schaalia turicensis]|uniref:recombinase family protein n=1 Tax=Schaalia turicensis TaxID=131111 RepID=UPI001C5FFE50|nr:recombinase family protein [Schaalia turicensis]QYB16720.1 recombinase family protein [Schaalia turicensis]